MEPVQVSPESVCINCGGAVTTKYCAACGHPNPPTRMSWANMLSEFQATSYGFDGKFFRTIKDLTLRPGVAARQSIAGNRISHFGPVGYFFFMITLVFLVASMLGIDIVAFLKHVGEAGLQQEPKPGSGMDKLVQQVFQGVSDNMKLVVFIYIPIQAFCARYIFFRKSGLNFLEHSVLPFYLQGHIYWLSIFSLFYFYFSGIFLPSWITILISISYFCYGYASFFTYQNKIKSFFKGFGVYMMSQLFFVLLVIIIVVLMIVFDKDVYEMIKPSNNR